MKNWTHLVKKRNHVCNVSNNKGFSRLEVQNMRRANSGIRTSKHQKLQNNFTLVKRYLSSRFLIFSSFLFGVYQLHHKVNIVFNGLNIFFCFIPLMKQKRKPPKEEKRVKEISKIKTLGFWLLASALYNEGFFLEINETTNIKSNLYLKNNSKGNILCPFEQVTD